jgi:hypothetical protein
VVEGPTAQDVGAFGFLAFTGSNTVPCLAAGLLLLALGLLVVLWSRRRREPQAG